MGWRDRKPKNDAPPAKEPEAAAPPPSETAGRGPVQAEGPQAAEPAPQAPPSAEALAAKVDELAKALADCQAKIDALQRQAADLDNRRKRVERQAEESVKYALQDLALALLPVIDNFERALSHSEETPEAQALHDGLKLVHDQLLTVLKKFHVEKIEARGQPFDPHHHEAIAQVESAEHAEGTVIDVQQDGYLLHDRLLRPASVIVSRQGQAQAEPGQAAPSDQGCDGGTLPDEEEE